MRQRRDRAESRPTDHLGDLMPNDDVADSSGVGSGVGTDAVRACFEAYLAQDRAATERLLAEDFVFSSPQDDHLDKAAYLGRCFPTADRLRSQEILRLVDAGWGGVFILYEYELNSGGRYRNAEFITVRDGQLVETQVFFGGSVSMD
jgi:ketosteroid isomerase-like protein